MKREMEVGGIEIAVKKEENGKDESDCDCNKSRALRRYICL